MKHCNECEFHSRQAVQIGPNPNQLGVAFVCTHKECSDPVDGSPLPCSLSRRDSIFCGITARFYKKAEAKPQTDTETKVIELAK